MGIERYKCDIWKEEGLFGGVGAVKVGGGHRKKMRFGVLVPKRQ